MLVSLHCVLWWSWHNVLGFLLEGNEFGEPVIQERQIRIADNPLAFLSPSVSVSVCNSVCVCVTNEQSSI